MSDPRASVDGGDPVEPEKLAGILRYRFDEGTLIVDTGGDLGAYWYDGDRRWYLETKAKNEALFLPETDDAPVSMVTFHRPGGETEPSLDRSGFPDLQRGVDYVDAVGLMQLLDAVKDAAEDDSVTEEERRGVHAATYAIGVTLTDQWPSADVELVVDPNGEEIHMRGRPAGMRGHNVPTGTGDLDFTCPGCGEVGAWSQKIRGGAQCLTDSSQCRIRAFSPFVEEI